MKPGGMLLEDRPCDLVRDYDCPRRTPQGKEPDHDRCLRVLFGFFYRQWTRLAMATLVKRYRRLMFEEETDSLFVGNPKRALWEPMVRLPADRAVTVEEEEELLARQVHLHALAILEGRGWLDRPGVPLPHLEWEPAEFWKGVTRKLIGLVRTDLDEEAQIVGLDPDPAGIPTRNHGFVCLYDPESSLGVRHEIRTLDHKCCWASPAALSDAELAAEPGTGPVARRFLSIVADHSTTDTEKAYRADPRVRAAYDRLRWALGSLFRPVGTERIGLVVLEGAYADEACAMVLGDMRGILGGDRVVAATAASFLRGRYSGFDGRYRLLVLPDLMSYDRCLAETPMPEVSGPVLSVCPGARVDLDALHDTWKRRMKIVPCDHCPVETFPAQGTADGIERLDRIFTWYALGASDYVMDPDAYDARPVVGSRNKRKRQDGDDAETDD